MAEMDIGFGPGKFNPDLNTQMGGIDPLLQKAAKIKSPEEGIGVAVDLAGEEKVMAGILRRAVKMIQK